MSMLPLMPAGSLLGPISTKSVYITGKRFTPKPSATNFTSSALACTNATSASPRLAVSSAWPVPCATTRTSMPVLALNAGRMWPNRPESWVEVVEATTIDLSCAAAGAMQSRVAATISSVRRWSMRFSLLFCSSDQKLAGDEAARVGGLRRREECPGGGTLDHAAAMQQYDLATQASRLAEVVGRHHHLDAAQCDRADDVLDRLGGGGVEARARLVEAKHRRRLGERARQRQPLLLAAGEFSRGTVGQAVEADQRAELGHARGALAARHAGGGERVADVAGGAAAEHHRALEHDRAPRRRHVRPAAPAQAAARRRDQPHHEAEEGGLAGAVRPDQHRRRSGRQRERDAVEDGHAARADAGVRDHDRQVGGRRAHGHAAKRSPARRSPQAAALTAMTIAISTRPSPMASGRSPFEVSSAIAVVMTRVKPSILPPTMSTAP